MREKLAATAQLFTGGYGRNSASGETSYFLGPVKTMLQDSMLLSLARADRKTLIFCVKQIRIKVIWFIDSFSLNLIMILKLKIISLESGALLCTD